MPASTSAAPPAPAEPTPSPPRLALGARLALEPANGPGRGKTAGMGRGLLLLWDGAAASGEGAGFGVPVARRGGETWFPSVAATRGLADGGIERVYRLDREVRWYRGGRELPAWCTAIGERLVRPYRALPLAQHALLRWHGRVLSGLRLAAAMRAVAARGECIVRYRADGGSLLVEVSGATLPEGAVLSLLNEAAGEHFTRLRLGGRLREDREVPAWVELDPTARFEAPGLGLAFGIAGDEGAGGGAACGVAGGREVGHGLDWAGIALMPRRLPFTYRVTFSARDAGQGQPCGAAGGGARALPRR